MKYNFANKKSAIPSKEHQKCKNGRTESKHYNYFYQNIFEQPDKKISIPLYIYIGFLSIAFCILAAILFVIDEVFCGGNMGFKNFLVYMLIK